MRLYGVALRGLLAVIPFVATGQSKSELLGVWRTQEEGHPSVILHVSDEGGSLVGAIEFYMTRRDPGKEAVVTAGIPNPILLPKVDANVLTFEVSHRLAHPPRTLHDPPVIFHLKVMAPNKAVLTRGEDTKTLEMVRDAYR